MHNRRASSPALLLLHDLHRRDMLTRIGSVRLRRREQACVAYRVRPYRSLRRTIESIIATIVTITKTLNELIEGAPAAECAGRIGRGSCQRATAAYPAS